MGIEALVTMAAVSAAAGGYATYKAAEDTNRTNRELQEQANKLNEGLTREQWGREDTARQRAVKDMLAAGLNPNLAAGAPAATSPAARMEAPQLQRNTAIGDMLGGLSTRIQSAIAMDTTMAQAELTKRSAKTESERPDALRAAASRDMATASKAYADAGFKNQASRIMKKDADLWVKQNIDVRDRDAVSKVTKQIPEIKQKAEDFLKNPPKSLKDYMQRYQDAYK